MRSKLSVVESAGRIRQATLRLRYRRRMPPRGRLALQQNLLRKGRKLGKMTRLDRAALRIIYEGDESFGITCWCRAIDAKYYQRARAGLRFKEFFT